MDFPHSLRLFAACLCATGFSAAACGLFPDLDEYGECAGGACTKVGPDASTGGSAGAAGSATGGSGALGGSAGNGGSAGSGGSTADAGDPCGAYRGGTMVSIPGESYCVDGTETTRAMYEQFLSEVGGVPTDSTPECAWNTTYVPPSYLWTASATGQNDPVRGISWCSAQAYCAWANKRLCGKISGGSLSGVDAAAAPEAQWYFACSKKTTFKYPYGTAHEPGRCNDEQVDAGLNGQTEVASLPNCEGPYPGLFDLSGNVLEWVDACGPDDPDAGAKGASCAMQGGAWHFLGNATTCSFKQGVPRSTAGPYTGFRCCKDL